MHNTTLNPGLGSGLASPRLWTSLLGFIVVLLAIFMIFQVLHQLFCHLPHLLCTNFFIKKGSSLFLWPLTLSMLKFKTTDHFVYFFTFFFKIRINGSVSSSSSSLWSEINHKGIVFNLVWYPSECGFLQTRQEDFATSAKGERWAVQWHHC